MRLKTLVASLFAMLRLRRNAAAECVTDSSELGAKKDTSFAKNGSGVIRDSNECSENKHKNATSSVPASVESLIRQDLMIGAGIDAGTAPHATDNGSSAPQSVYPRHVAIIMDGNNRWAKQRSRIGISGHRAGVEAIRGVLRGCEQFDVEVLTLFAFSSENWARPEREVNELMRLFRDYLDGEAKELHSKNIRLRFVGRRDRLEQSLVERMQWAEQLTFANTGRTLVLAVDYGGRWDILQACQDLVVDFVNEVLPDMPTSEPSTKAKKIDSDYVKAFVDEQALAERLSLSDLPEPDLCIRTGGEVRVSNFLLWQFSYAEFYFTDCYWPDFSETEFAHAVEAFASRQRRFGRTTEQVQLAEPLSQRHA